MQPEPHEPPATGPIELGSMLEYEERPGAANTDNNRAALVCPDGQGAGASASTEGRRNSKVDWQSRQRYSYIGMWAG